MFVRKESDRPDYDPSVELDADSWRLPVAPEPEPEPSIFDQDWQGNVVLFTDDGQIAVRATSVAEAKLAIKQLRLRKKAVGLEKREVTQAITAINAERRDHLAGQGRMPRGRGGFMQLVRAFEGMSRDQQRAEHERRLDPYQAEKARLDDYALSIDKLITQLEGFILQQSE